MIVITAAWKAKEGKEKELAGHLKKMVSAVKKNEPKCLQYTLHQGLEDKTLLYFYERYTDKVAVEYHKNTPHFRELIASTEKLIARPVEVGFYEILE
ncbi:MAG: antibiotic biosynthesis monooxygenase [Deltaproteobacteria bacterium]|nr:antibiotic biosynthesis monooxygenase [Deltaproteobacteria bacterium]